MKKNRIAVLCGVCMALSLAACSGNSSGPAASSGNAEGTEAADNGTETAAKTVKAARTQPPEVASADMDIQAKKLVKKLCDYSNVPVTITGTYDLSEEEIQSVILSDLQACYADLEEVKDRDSIQEGDTVKVDYTGYLNGEAFDGGSAQGTYVKIGDGNGFIPGFTDSLVGAKAGDDVEGKVTFPEDYGKEELNGKEVVFKFKVYGIYQQVDDYAKLAELAKDADSLVNTNINATFGNYGITDFATLREYEETRLKNQLNSSKYSDSVNAIKEYMLENCEVEIPEDYLNARVVEYQISFENSTLADDQTLEDYLSTNLGMTVEQAQESWTESARKQIKSELIFELVAEKEKIELDEKEFETYITTLVSSASSSGSQMSSADDVYQYYGAGNTENGKKYMQRLYLMNKAIDKIYDSAKITVKAPEKASETETESTK